MKLKVFFFSLLLIALCLFTTHFILVGKAVYGDGRYYYSYLPTFLIQHTVNFATTFKHTQIPTWFLTPKGLPANVYPIGPFIFWTIPYLFAYGITFILGQAQAYSLLSEFLIGAWDCMLTMIGLFLLYKSLRGFFALPTTILSISCTFFATNLLFYGSLDTVNSHSITFFLASLFLFVFLKAPSLKNSILRGLIIGLLTLTRPQEILFLLLPALQIVTSKQIIRNILYLLITFIFVIAVFLPQSFLWYILWGSWWINPYLHVATFHFFQPNILGVLFNGGSGLFLWTPITILMSSGLLLFALKNKKLGLPFFGLFLAQLYLIASWSIWWEGASYSARMTISSLPFLAFGLAYLFERKYVKPIGPFLTVFFSLLNVVLIFYFLLSN